MSTCVDLTVGNILRIFLDGEDSYSTKLSKFISSHEFVVKTINRSQKMRSFSVRGAAL
jgi:hypothetical protein